MLQHLCTDYRQHINSLLGLSTGWAWDKECRCSKMITNLDAAAPHKHRQTREALGSKLVLSA
jgi:hypothetical protein